MNFRFLFCQNFFLFHLKLFFAQRSGACGLRDFFIKHGSRTPFIYRYFIAMEGARQLCLRRCRRTRQMYRIVPALIDVRRGVRHGLALDNR